MSTKYALTLDDILDPQGFIRSLNDPDYPPANYIRSKVGHPLTDELNKLRGNRWIDPTFALKPLSAINSLIEGPSIYDLSIFDAARVTRATLAQIKEHAPTELAPWINRALITEAFPREVRLALNNEAPEWFQFYVEKFAELAPDFEAIKTMVERELKAACKLMSPLAIIQVRVKDVSSFAEKAWRKGYANPILKTTDAVGARVIVETQDQVLQICEYIKSRFDIDEANSVDHRSFLDTQAFGYRSIHYIVMLPKSLVDNYEKHGKIPPRSWQYLREWKTEIQVRTILQHAHATISHDRVYKSPLTVPESLQRDLSRVSALLEQADIAFGNVVERLESYYGSYGKHLDAVKQNKEIATLQTALKYEPDEINKPRIALDLARIYKGTWRWDQVVSVLSEHKATDCSQQAEVHLEYGHALCRLSRRNPQSVKYKRGLADIGSAVKALDSVSAHQPVRLRVRAHAYLAWAHGNLDSVPDRTTARDEYQKAYQLDVSNPYSFAARLEFEHNLDPEHMEAAATVCRGHARADIEIPWAFFTMGRLYLMAGMADASLAAYCKAIHVCGYGGADQIYPREILDDERRILVNAVGHGDQDLISSVQDLLDLAIVVYHKKASADTLARLKQRVRRTTKYKYLTPIRIVAGGTHPTVQAQMESYKQCISKGLDNFSGTIISGGTLAGIPGMIGDQVAELRKHGNKVDAWCYLPSSLPGDAPKDNRYNIVIKNVGHSFGPSQPIASWIDLVTAGIAPSNVRLLGINGGTLTAFEYKLALALGAKVGVIRESGRAAKELAPDEDWHGAPNLLWLPADPQTVWAFLQLDESPQPAACFEKMGERIHESFLLKNEWKTSKDKTHRPWTYLDPNMQASNIYQAIHSAEILASKGYLIEKIEPAEVKIKPYTFSTAEEETVKAMAEMEHGRWNIERLSDGWIRGHAKNVEKKISPFLVPWIELDPKTRQLDIDFVRDWPSLLAEVGLKIVPPDEPPLIS